MTPRRRTALAGVSGLRRQRRNHRVEQRQGDGRAHAAKHRPARDGFLGDDHEPRPPHPKRCALHERENRRRPAVVVGRRRPHDAADGWRVVVFQSAADRVGEQLVGHGPDELLLLRHQRTPQRRRAVDFRAVQQHAGCVDRRAGVRGAPLADAHRSSPGSVPADPSAHGNSRTPHWSGGSPASRAPTRLAVLAALFERRHVRRRRRRRRGQDVLQQPLAADGGRRARRVRRHRQHAALPSRPKRFSSASVTRRKWLP